jgi:hypothetical protein
MSAFMSAYLSTCACGYELFLILVICVGLCGSFRLSLLPRHLPRLIALLVLAAAPSRALSLLTFPPLALAAALLLTQTWYVVSFITSFVFVISIDTWGSCVVHM